MNFSGPLMAWITILELGVLKDHRMAGDISSLNCRWKRSLGANMLPGPIMNINNNTILYNNMTAHYTQLANMANAGKRKIENILYNHRNRKVKKVAVPHFILEEFKASTMDHITGFHKRQDCNITVENGFLKSTECPGKLTVLTFQGIQKVKCKDIETTSVTGPVLIWNKHCHQQLEAIPNDNLRGRTQNSEIGQPNIFNDYSEYIEPTIAGLSLMLMFAMFIRTIFLHRFLSKFKEGRDCKITKTGLEFTRYLTYDAINGLESNNMAPNDSRPFEVETRRLSWVMLLCAIVLFFPARVISYALISSQKIGPQNYQYSFLMDSSEIVYTNRGLLNFTDTDEIAPIAFQFFSYDWSLQTYSRSHCLRSGCGNLIECQEDILPFRPITDKVRVEMGISED